MDKLRGYICESNQQRCQLLITSAVSMPTASCADSTSSVTYLSIPHAITEGSSVETISTLTALAPLLQMMYQASDSPTATLSGSAISTAATASPSTSTSIVAGSAFVDRSVGWDRRGRKSGPPYYTCGYRPCMVQEKKAYVRQGDGFRNQTGRIDGRQWVGLGDARQ